MSDSAEAPAKLVPDPDGRNADFYRHAATGQLHIQQCNACGHHHHRKRHIAGKGGMNRLVGDRPREDAPASARLLPRPIGGAALRAHAARKMTPRAAFVAALEAEFFLGAVLVELGVEPIGLG